MSIGTTEKVPTQSILLSEYSFEFYCDFTDLPSQQLSAIVGAISGVNRVVLESAFESDLRLADLFLESIETEESIRIKFRQGRRFLPTFDFPDDDLEIGLPRWTAALFLSGGILIGGAQVLDAGNTIMDHLNADSKQEQVIHDTFDVKQLRDPETGLGQRLRRNYNAFDSEITSSNINEWTIDIIRARPNDEGDGDSEE